MERLLTRKLCQLAKDRQAGLRAFCEKYPQIDYDVASGIILGQWMTDTESGPEDEKDRWRWLQRLRADRDRFGRTTKAHAIKGKGRAIFELLEVPWRRAEVSRI